jgi:hypothetical protein
LTFSRYENNADAVQNVLKAGGNVAVVAAARRSGQGAIDPAGHLINF